MKKKQAQDYIQQVLNSRFDQEQFKLFVHNLLNEFEPKDNNYSGNLIPEAFRDHIAHYKRIGKYTDPEGEQMDILIVQTRSVKKLERTRTALRNFVVRHLKNFDKYYALVAFYSKEDNGKEWRLSLVKIDIEQERTEEGKIKVREEIVPAKRFSFLVGEHENAHTAQKQLLPLLVNDHSNPLIVKEKDGDGSLEGAFSVETVTDEFYQQYKELYLKLTENASLCKVLEKKGLDTNRFVKKLLGQIVFLYFLQKKGWLGVPRDKKMGEGSKRFLQDKFEEIVQQGGNYFNDFLRYLFYEALAKEHNDEGLKYYFKRLGCKIPFLNGGLFEAEYDWEHTPISIPNELFRNNEKNKSGDKGTGILDVFDRYNFTIKEDEPLEKEVAVDPEMLGKVFENMLEIKERKSKGAFYTPREIVHYMCQESLIHYLDNAVNDYSESYQPIDSGQASLFGGSTDKKGNLKIELENKGNIRVPKEDIEQLIRKGHLVLEHETTVTGKGKETKSYSYKLPESIRKYAKELDDALADIKICDPAIGSGAFPVGMLNEIVIARLVLNSFLQNEKYTPYYLKRHAIQESIYGVDIDASAIDIARLRLWLSMIVDEEDYDTIEALPNLDYKIVCGNSLIGLPENAMRDLKVEKELEILKEAFFHETDETKKKALRKKINSKIRQLLDSAESFAGYKIDFDFKLFFSEVWHQKGGFDVVIGNPPYLDYRKINSIITKKITFNNTGRIRPNLYIYFIDKGTTILNKKGCISYINPNQFLSIDSGLEIRKYLLNNTDIKFIKDVSYVPVFQNACTYTCVWLASKYLNEDNILISKFEDLNNFYSVHFKVKQSELLNTKDFLIPISPENPIIKRLDDFKQKLKSISELFWGTSASGYGKKKISHKDFLKLSKVKQKKYIPIVQTADIKNFQIEWKEDYLPREIFSNKVLEKFNLEKIVVGRLTKRLQASIDYNKYGVGKACVIVNLNYNISVLVSILNSSIINYWYYKKFESTHMAGGYIRFDKPYLEQTPIPIVTNEDEIPFNQVVKYFTSQISKVEGLAFGFFKKLLDVMVFELYFPEELKSANKQILPHLGDLRPITDDMSDEEKLAIIQSEFERLYDPNHPVRNNMETLDSVEEVRIIREALK